jgi:hypothetical protein
VCQFLQALALHLAQQWVLASQLVLACLLGLQSAPASQLVLASSASRQVRCRRLQRPPSCSQVDQLALQVLPSNNGKEKE